MTKNELLKLLAGYPDDIEIRIAQPTNNYWQEVAAPPLGDVIDGHVRLHDANTTCPNKLLDEEDLEMELEELDEQELEELSADFKRVLILKER